MPSADPPSEVHSLDVSQVPKKYMYTLLQTHAIVRIIYQPIRVEEEVGVHGSLGNVTMEKSENWPEKKKAGHLISVSLLLKSGSHEPEHCCRVLL